MVRKALPQEDRPRKPARVYVPNYEAQHREYWSPEAAACRARFAAAVGKTTIEESFHIRDGFRILCDGLPGGEECRNNIGIAPLPLTHDGLCERCRRDRVPFPPRITLDPVRVVCSWNDLDDWIARGRPTEVARGDAWEPESDEDVPPPAEMT